MEMRLVVMLMWMLKGGSCRVYLPEIVTPLNYEVTLLPVLELRQRLCGHVAIDVVANNSGTSIFLNAADMNFFRVAVVPFDYENQTDLANQQVIELSISY